MAFANFESLLKASIGLDAASIGISAIERAVRERQIACHLQDADDYWHLVRASKAEEQALIEAVVVPETWFFRDVDAFAALGRLARDMCLSPSNTGTRANAVVRILSLPCSTGEEPYSIAMALLDADVQPRSFRVDAVDVSQHALAEAREGVYRRGSFRGQALDYRRRHFEPTATGFRILEHVRAQVTFQHGNVLVPGTLPAAGVYDVVFCRNVLIYFDCAAQERAIATLANLLSPSGLLFVGPAEAGVLLNHGFVSAKIPKAHAFCRADAVAPAPRRKTPAIERRTIPAMVPPPARPRAEGLGSAVSASALAETTVAPDNGVSTILTLANEGRFGEAAARCEEHLERNGPSAQIFYLLGLVRDASHHQLEAAAYYRKALYLDPRHHDALVHLALLLDTQNNSAEAERLRARARRLPRQEGTS